MEDKRTLQEYRDRIYLVYSFQLTRYTTISYYNFHPRYKYLTIQCQGCQNRMKLVWKTSDEMCRLYIQTLRRAE